MSPLLFLSSHSFKNSCAWTARIQSLAAWLVCAVLFLLYILEVVIIKVHSTLYKENNILQSFIPQLVWHYYVKGICSIYWTLNVKCHNAEIEVVNSLKSPYKDGIIVCTQRTKVFRKVLSAESFKKMSLGNPSNTFGNFSTSGFC
jgi:hypothetical protein